MAKKLEVNEADPCGAAEQLRAAYYAIVAGQAAQIVTFRAGPSQVERSVTFHKADLARLEGVIRDFERQCDAQRGTKRKRFAIGNGGVRR